MAAPVKIPHPRLLGETTRPSEEEGVARSRGTGARFRVLSQGAASCRSPESWMSATEGPHRGGHGDALHGGCVNRG